MSSLPQAIPDSRAPAGNLQAEYAGDFIPGSTPEISLCQFSRGMSAKPGNVFEEQFGNQLESLSRVCDAAVQFLEERGVEARAVNLAHLAIEEMGTNILKYAYDDTAHHDILLRLTMEPDCLLVVLEDDGHEFNPVQAPLPDLELPPEQRQPGGLGIHLIRNLATQMDYQRCEGRNRLTVRIAC